MLIVVVLIFGVQLVLTSVLSSVWNAPQGSLAAHVQEALSFLVLAALVIAWVVFFERRPVKTLGFRRPAAGAVNVAIGILIGVAMISIPILIIWTVGGFENVDPPTGSATGASALALLVAILVLVLFQAGTEETLMRGFVLQATARALPGWLAVVLNALFFAVVHLAFSPLPFITIFLFGIFAVLMTLRTSGLWMVAGVHAGWNFAMGNIYGIPVSGLPPQQNSLFYLAPSAGAPTWLTGGDFGAEGSAVTAIMILVAALVAWRLVTAATNTRRTSLTSTGPGSDSL
jgi:membrane protease YdiL (CAAX protease family)